MITDDQSATTPTDPDPSEQTPTVEDLAVTVPEPPPFEQPIHPLAASFPMLEGEELDDLVDDIRDNGLHQPIVLDKNGQLIDGRNRLKACELAGVEPIFTTVDTDLIAYILGVNVNRRHLSNGQQAMAIATAYPEPENGNGGRGRRNREVTAEFSARLVQQARFVLRHAPDIAAKVRPGSSSLGDAYTHATNQKKERDEYARVRKQAGDLWDAIVAIGVRLTSNIEKWETAFLDQEDFLRQVHADAQQIIEHATELAEI